ncbi:helix-turn-helix transcriptional regulator [Ruminococcus sp.]|uniref:helix-turn-helix transcriptional regulator n=1 Tax=Ruminococcus sp. TaxID=41978 RepID=UPI00292DAC5B|nr:helix-turn-helix transcriptional regulator [uncultured Ruminococcus sp.]
MLNEQLKATLCSLAHAIAVHYGKSCEVAIHDLTVENAADSSIIYIENGEVTGRRVGDGASAVVLEELSQAEQNREDRIGYFTKTSDGKVLKSTTVYIRDEKGRATAIFSINHDITALSVAAASLTELTAPATACEPERITPHVGELLDELLWKSTELIGKPVSLMNKDDKQRAIRYLNSKGALLITKSGDKIAKYFGISKFTLYSYLTDEEDTDNT